MWTVRQRRGWRREDTRQCTKGACNASGFKLIDNGITVAAGGVFVDAFIIHR